MTIRITDIFIYPVKSLGGFRVSEAEVTERGLRLDRRWMVVDSTRKFITQRDYPAMAALHVAESLVPGQVITITMPDGESLAIPAAPAGQELAATVWKDTVPVITVSPEADMVLSAYLGISCQLVYMPNATRRQVNQKYAESEHITSFADGFPILLANQSSLDDLNARMASPIPMDRFRANIVVEGAEAFAEDGWGRVQIGSAMFEAVKPCTRCLITTIDQSTGQKTGKEPLKTLASFRNSEKGVRFGENLLVTKTGIIKVGNEVEFLAARGDYPRVLEDVI
jgi:uncharacterized protein YcbX